MSAQTPPADGFGAYLHTIATGYDDDEPLPILARPSSGFYDFDDPPDDDANAEPCDLCDQWPCMCEGEDANAVLDLDDYDRTDEDEELDDDDEDAAARRVADDAQRPARVAGADAPRSGGDAAVSDLAILAFVPTTAFDWSKWRFHW